MSRALGPRPSAAPGGTAAGWAVLATCWGLAAARIAAALTGGTVTPFGLVFVTDLAHGQTAMAWPHTSSAAVGVACVVLTGLAAVVTVAAARVIRVRRNVPGDPVAALARNPQIAGLTHRHAARSATRLRRSLAGTDPRAVQPADAGLALGRFARSDGRPGPAVYAGW
jgi:hypothetical protein